MKTIDIHLRNNKTTEVETNFVDLYNEATEDYEFWSTDFNMHFGYFRPFKNNPFKRDSMLNEMNNQVFNRLNIQKNDLIIDLGCGMGSTMLHALKKFENLKVFGVTLSDFQVKEGNKRLNKHSGLIVNENYNHTSLKNNSADGVYAIESLCHSGHAKKSFKEAFRILKKGHRLVVADAFLKEDADDLCIGNKYAYAQLCKGWDLKGLGNINTVKNQMEEIGFKNIVIEDISFRVAPSVLHVPFAITGFLLKKIFKKDPIKPQSLNNLKGSLFALVSGLHMKSFGYYLINGEK